MNPVPAQGAPLGAGAPFPCAICGAPMVPPNAVALHQTPEWSCQYCGHREGLPPQEAERQRYLRLRLLQLSRAREQAEAPLTTFRTMNESWAFGAGIMLLVGAWQAYGFATGLASSGHVDPAQGLFMILPLAIAVGCVCGWLGMRRVFALQLRSLLRARPPLQPGLVARCRGCGADLPAARAPELKCSYCNAWNLLDPTLARDAATLLANEAEEYRSRVRPWSQDPKVYLAPARAFYLWAGVGAFITTLGGLALVLIFS